MRGPYETPTETCPYCGEECEAEFVDIGVGMQQVTPYECHKCHAYQAGPYDKPEYHQDFDDTLACRMGHQTTNRPRRNRA
jgi:hypothetical protein